MRAGDKRTSTENSRCWCSIVWGKIQKTLQGEWQLQYAYRISVEGRKRIKMKTKTENIAGACVYSMRIESNLRHNVILSFS